MANDLLKKYCDQLVSLNKSELALIDTNFFPAVIKRKEYLLMGGKVCDFIAFIKTGVLRHFHVKDGEEKTCDISFENTFVTDLLSFSNNVPSVYFFQAMEDTEVEIIRKENLVNLYRECPKYETIGRLMAEKVANRSTEIAMSLTSDKPETRYLKLLEQRPDLFQRVPQKYIANFLGISPESLSRIRKRILKSKRS